MTIESNTSRYRALSRKSVERALHRSSDAIVLHLRYAGSDVAMRTVGSRRPDDEETTPEI